MCTSVAWMRPCFASAVELVRVETRESIVGGKCEFCGHEIPGIWKE